MINSTALTMARKRKNNRKIRGTSGSDVLTGNSRKNVIRGYEGDDLIESGEGRDKAFGGAGDDTFVTVNGGKGYVKIMDFDKGDVLEFCGCPSTTIEDRGGDAWIVNGNDVMAVIKGWEERYFNIDYTNRVITIDSELLT